MSADDQPARIRLVAGLGNPGRKYEDTRHNVGFMALDRIAEAAGAQWSTEKKWECLLARDGEVFLVKPQTFMNRSGRSVAAVSRFHKIAPEEICVVYDDLDLPLGTLRLRASGSAGGHNGMKSLIQCLGTQDFPRLKIGIGRSEGPGDVVDHVLSPFLSAERDAVDDVLGEAAAAVECLRREGLTAAMNRFNRKPKPAKPEKSSVKNEEPQAPAGAEAAPEPDDHHE